MIPKTPGGDVAAHAAVVFTMHAAICAARRCLRKYRVPGDDASATIVCQMPAVWRQITSPEESVYWCHFCQTLYGIDAEDGDVVEPAPHAKPMMLFLDSFRDRMKLKSHHRMVGLAEDFLLALPPCPPGPKLGTTCPRCIWMDGYAGRTAMYEMTKALARLKPEPFASWPTDHIANLGHVLGVSS